MQEEIWKDIPGYEGRYQVSNIGRVKSMRYRNTKQQKILKIGKNRGGYMYFIADKNKHILVHRAVAMAFIENNNSKLVVNHKNGIRDDNTLENIELVTSSENRIHCIRVLGVKNNFQTKHPHKGKFGSNSHSSKKVSQYSKEGKLINVWGSIKEASDYFGISDSCISDCCRGRAKYIKGFKWEYS